MMVLYGLMGNTFIVVTIVIFVPRHDDSGPPT